MTKAMMMLLVVFPTVVVAQSLDEEAILAMHDERPDDPPAAVTPAKLGYVPFVTADVVERNGFTSIQVNVGEGGYNISGDAANEPSIAVDPTAPNRMVIGWRQFDSVSSNHREAGVAMSVDGGRTWTASVLNDGVFRSDPVLEADSDGTFFYNSLAVPGGQLLADFFGSEDGGQTWAGPRPAYGGDKVWIAIDRSEGIGHGNIYESWSTASNVWGERIFSRSTDGGLTFSVPIALHPAPIWGTLAIGPEGEVYLAGNASFELSTFVVLRSIDAQDPLVDEPTFEIFVAPLGGRQGTGNGNMATPNPVGLLGQVWLGVDTSDGPNRGNLYLLSSVDPPGTDPQDVHFIRSEDAGESWSEVVRPYADDRGAWQWFGTMSVAPNGRIDVIWIESLARFPSYQGEIYYTSSHDGGFTWATPVAVTPSFNSHAGWPRQDKMGDYFHMRSDLVGADLAFAATFNREQDVYHMRIGPYDCDGNGVDDVADISSGELRDCDVNQIPDYCEIKAQPELDSNGNWILDVCQAPREVTGRAR